MQSVQVCGQLFFTRAGHGETVHLIVSSLQIRESILAYYIAL